MTREQYLYLKLMEEAAEVAQRASKTIQFGSEDVELGHIDTNTSRLMYEIYDLLSIIEIMGNMGLIPHINYDTLHNHMIMKEKKLEKYYTYSQKLGYVNAENPRT